jgi:general secretion pathway protein D
VNAEIGAVIQAISKISGRNFIIDPRVKGTLNIVTARPVARHLTYSILLSALRLQGYAAVEGDGVTKIVPEADAKLHAVPVGKGKGAGGGDRLTTQVFNLKHESASQLVPVIRPLVSPNNTVTAYPGNNSLVVTDYAENIGRIAQIIESIDVPQGDMRVIPLQHASALDLAQTVTRLLSDGGRAPRWLPAVPSAATPASASR